MKNIALLLLAVVTVSSCKKKDGTPPASPAANDSAYSYFINNITGKFATTFTNDGNVIILASPYMVHATPRDILLYKVSQAGAVLWTKTIVIPDTAFYGAPSFHSVAPAADGGYLLCGEAFVKEPYMGSFIFSTDIALLKLTAAGDVQWLKTFGGHDEDYASAIIKMKDGNYLIAGQSVSFNTNPYSDIYLVKVNGNGDELWSRDYKINDQQALADIIETAQGGIMVYGNDQYGTGSSVTMLLAADANGNELWHKTITTGNVEAGCAAEAANGDVIACYNKNGQPHIMRVSNTGNLVWDRADYLPAANYQYAAIYSSMKKNSDNTFTLTGGSKYIADSFMKCAVLKIDEQGNILYNKTLPVTCNSRGENILKADNGNNIITGMRTRDSTVSDVFFSKTNDY